jgi:uncharacterized membrane protein
MPVLLPIQSRVRMVVLITWLAMFLLVIVHRVLPDFSLSALAVGLLFSLPLFAPLYGLVRADRYTYSWATLCVLPYFIVGVTESVSNPSIRLWANALLGASLLWFFAMISFLRVTPKLKM